MSSHVIVLCSSTMSPELSICLCSRQIYVLYSFPTRRSSDLYSFTLSSTLVFRPLPLENFWHPLDAGTPGQRRRHSSDDWAHGQRHRHSSDDRAHSQRHSSYYLAPQSNP